jgi:hypothetical protein
MRGLKAFIKSILWVEIVAVLGLLLAGVILTWVEQDYRSCETFFTYRMRHMDYLPAWFIATLMLIALNGLYMFRLATIEGMFRTPRGTGWGEWGVSVPINPLRLFAINLVTIPAILVLFLFIRASCL